MAGLVNKRIWIIANWKSNKNISEALDWISKVGVKVSDREDIKVVVCPTFSCIPEVTKAIKVGNFNITVGSQDLSPFGVGAYTGEEPASLLQEMVKFSIIGHSERREHFSESDEMVAKKALQALDNQITPLLCVQDSATPVPQGVKIVAYEPIFAIGTGQSDTPQNADAVAKALKQFHGQDLEVLYGGSVNSSNVRSFIEMENISGVLIGKSSLEAEEFVKIIAECER